MLGNMSNVTPREQGHPEAEALRPRDDIVLEGLHWTYCPAPGQHLYPSTWEVFISHDPPPPHPTLFNCGKKYLNKQVTLMPSGALCMTIYDFTVVNEAAHALFTSIL